MFDQTFVDGEGKTHKGWTVLLSFGDRLNRTWLVLPFAAAVIGLTKSLGKELAQTGVLVNCVTPAAAKTAIFDQMTEQHINYMLSKIPMNRFVTVDEVASLVCWLASEDCAFSTGGVFDISGGRATY